MATALEKASEFTPPNQPPNLTMAAPAPECLVTRIRDFATELLTEFTEAAWMDAQVASVSCNVEDRTGDLG